MELHSCEKEKEHIWENPLYISLVGGFNPSEKYESQLGWFFPIMEKNVPNHQPVMEVYSWDRLRVDAPVTRIAFKVGRTAESMVNSMVYVRYICS